MVFFAIFLVSVVGAIVMIRVRRFIFKNAIRKMAGSDKLEKRIKDLEAELGNKE